MSAHPESAYNANTGAIHLTYHESDWLRSLRQQSIELTIMIIIITKQQIISSS